MTPMGPANPAWADPNALDIFLPTHNSPTLPDDGSAQRVANAESLLNALKAAAVLQQSDLTAQIQIAEANATANPAGGGVLASEPLYQHYWVVDQFIKAVPVFVNTLNGWLLNHPTYRILVASGKMAAVPAYPDPPTAIAAYVPGLTF